MAQQFALMHKIRTDGNSTTDIVAVSDTLIGAEVYGRKMIKKVYDLDMFFNPVGWGKSQTDEFPARIDGYTHSFYVIPVLKVSQRTTV